VAGFCERGNKSSGSMRKRLLFDKLSIYKLLKEYPAPWKM
jgi:hypothetical protein